MCVDDTDVLLSDDEEEGETSKEASSRGLGSSKSDSSQDEGEEDGEDGEVEFKGGGSKEET